jgi:aminodeoxychorismate lyase
MIVFLNGAFLPAERAMISVFDRGFLYGDGLFETIRAMDGRLPLWESHWSRLRRGLEALQLPVVSGKDLHGHARELLRRNRLRDAIVRISVARGTGVRGYSPRGADRPTWVISARPAPALDEALPAPYRLHTASLRVMAGDCLAAFKTSSKLLHVLARAEAEQAGANDALVLNQHGRVAETASANIFWFEADRVCTPPLSEGGLAGVTRAFVMAIHSRTGSRCIEMEQDREGLIRSAGVFLTSSGLGVVEVTALDGVPLRRDPRITGLQQAYRDSLRAELSH